MSGSAPAQVAVEAIERPIWASWWDGRSRAALRIGLPAIMAVEQLVEAWQVAAQAADPERFPPSGALSRALASTPEAAWGIYAMIVLGLVFVARDRAPVKAGLWALGWAALLSEWQTQIFGSPSRNAFFPGAALLGWLLGQLWATTVLERVQGATAHAHPSRHRDFRERLGEAGALGCIAAAYVGSCASKLLAAGASWADASQVRALLLWQEPLADWPWLLAWRDAIVEDPSLARAAAIATLAIEGGALLLLFGPRLRLFWTAMLGGLHVTITLLCTMPYLEPMALLLLLAVPWPAAAADAHGVQAAARTGAAAAPDALDRPTLPMPMAVALACVVLWAWAIAPLGWRSH